ncbi:general transcription repressor [Malassezia yamatoensis]|uniref:General transcription repressor n=1 Tax=Malassezia yamatoensis TaxID=253288 RepID=A0AAJ5YR39_9BASI|nr:general transcription repressor [Malassezia yamatoensis]
MASVNPLAGVASGTTSSLGRTGSLTPSQPLPTHAAAHPTSPSTASHPLGSSAVAPGASHSIWSNRLMDLLNMVRHEFDVIGNDAVHFKSQRDEMEHRIAQQFNEINLIQDHVYELEKRHCDMVAQYEDEIRGLRHQLEVRGVTQPSDGHSYGSANRLTSRTPAGNNSRAFSPGRSRADRPFSLADSHNAGTTRSGRDADPSWPPSKRTKTSEQNSSSSHADQRSARMKREERDLKRPGTWVRSDVESISNPDNAVDQENSNEPLPESSKTSASSVNAEQNNPKTTQEDQSEQSIQSHKKEGADWVALYNPKAQPALDIDLVHTLVHDSVVCCVRFSPDGKYLATGCNRAANIFDTKTGEKISVLQDPNQSSDGDLYIRSVCFSPDGKYLATGAEDHQIRIWDIAEQKLKTTLEGHKQEIYSLEYSQDGQILASGSGDKTVQIWDVENGKPLHVLYTSPGLNHGPGVTAIALSPDGRLVAAGALDTFVRVWDTKTGKLRCRLKGHKDSIYSVAFMPDGKTLVSGSLDKTLKLWNLSCIIESLDSMDDEISNPSMCTSTLTGHKDYILSVSCSPEGQWIASGSKDRSVQFWDSRTGQSQLVLQGHKNSVIAINLSRSGNLLASGSGDFKYVQDKLTISARIWSYDVTS